MVFHLILCHIFILLSFISGVCAKYYQPVNTLKFEVCEGLTNQRIAIIHGFLVAYVTERAVVLPRIETSYLASESQKVPMSYMYDVEFLIDELKDDITFIREEDYKPAEITVLENRKNTLSVREWQSVYAVDLQIDCAFNIINTSPLASMTWKIEHALVFNENILSKARNISQAIGDSGYTAFHFRIEEDWLHHCSVWEKIGTTRDNCMTYTDVIENVFAIQRVPTDRPLYVAGAFTEEFIKSSPLFAQLLLRYNIVTKELLFDENELKEKMNGYREYFGAIDYVLCSHADLFIGNSVSTFSALIELQRLDKGEPVFHYNAGRIPLTTVIPMSENAKTQLVIREENQRLKWVFALVLISEHNTDFVDLAKVAVASAIENTSLDPVCILHVAEEVVGEAWIMDTIQWMIKAGVTVIQHTPKFADKIKRAYERGQVLGLNKFSSLYNNYYSMLGTCLRFDIPTLGFIDKYVLYSDVDVLFVSDLALSDFPTLPKYLMMGYETYKLRKYGNTGVTLFNLDGMRRTYRLLMDVAFAEEWVEQGLHFKEKGALDQGAVNLIYIGSHKQDVVPPKIFNWRPYWAAPHFYKSSIIHFRGPNPLEYQKYFDKSTEYLPEYKAIFERCTDPNVGGACRAWVSKWITMLNRIQHGYIPVYKV